MIKMGIDVFPVVTKRSTRSSDGARVLKFIDMHKCEALNFSRCYYLWDWLTDNNEYTNRFCRPTLKGCGFGTLVSDDSHPVWNNFEGRLSQIVNSKQDNLTPYAYYSEDGWYPLTMIFNMEDLWNFDYDQKPTMFDQDVNGEVISEKTYRQLFLSNGVDDGYFKFLEETKKMECVHFIARFWG
ncbi:hypothetical protein I5G20_14745 [Pseudomonas aeruginosa]|nr:hypothetical protein [Pseudomonas aeruginosa]